MLFLQQNEPDINNLTPEEMLDYFVKSSGFDRDDRYNEMIEELQEDKTLQELYKQVFLEKKPEVLQEKSQGMLYRLAHFQSQDLYTFQKFCNQMGPIRVDINYGIEYEGDFQAPIHHPRRNKVNGGLDHGVQEKNYVYCSFDSFPHHMSYNMGDKPVRELTDEELLDKCIYYVNDSELETKAEVVMMDIVNLYCSSKGLLKSYMNNIFDYQGGKEVIAKYLSIVFKDVNEAETFILRNNGQCLVDNWLNGSFAIPDGMTENRIQEIQNKMKEIYDKTGLVPPLSTEVRIHDRVELLGKNETVQQKINNIL